MKQISTKEFKNLYINNFNILSQFFNTNGIKYSLAYGTLLGAYREQDMIEWDNDIDLWITSENRDKLIAALNKIPNNFYYVSYEDGEEVFGMFRIYMNDLFRKLPSENKARHAYFDFFIADNIVDEELYAKNLNKILKLKRKYFFKKSITRPKNIIKRMLKPLVQFLMPSTRSINRKSSRIYALNKFGGDKIGIRFPDNRPFLYNKFGNLIEYTFHGYRFLGLENAADILIKMYGEDFMTPKDYGLNDGALFYIND